MQKLPSRLQRPELYARLVERQMSHRPALESHYLQTRHDAEILAALTFVHAVAYLEEKCGST